ncbi:hypothetical protein [Mariprofundus ferrooxydans]|uniref:Uncharacterized protein n=1 Tax=Mariprofundus ferrooxydans PV-1 TaxID=314345 RepID=Q0EWB9_9PROT|nr:hypothetical protein [Mariprofundus ferrooxydans]EAU53552.1 hypothetical protein SPV1_02903 [Mariprofundus ferrooxydans PV-1]KON47000.1 hypothetical protein AL013_10430 [Mariprofundus ferrooxydans]
MAFDLDRDSVLSALTKHIGKSRGITARQLVSEVTWKTPSDAHCRRLRHIIEDLRDEGHHICGHPSSGYFIAANEQELNDTCRFLTDRALASLKKVARMKKVSLPDIHGQLGLKI